MKYLAKVSMLCLLGCGQTAILPDSHSKKPALVLVHGYYGSFLSNSNGTEFVKVSKLLRGNFQIGLNQSTLGFKDHEPLKVDGLMGQIKIVPGVYTIDVYQKFFERLKSEFPEYQVIPFAYDWRESLDKSRDHLIEVLKDLRKAGASETVVLAHSMGGLVAAGAATIEPTAFSKIALFGVPFGGVTSILRNMQHGTGYAWNPKLLTPEVVASMHSVYSLAPRSNSLWINASSSLAELSDWEKYSLGLLSLPKNSFWDARVKYTKENLESSNKFLRSLASGPKINTLLVVARNQKTLERGYIHNGRAILRPEDAKTNGFNPDAMYGDGDGTVPIASTKPPSWFEVNEKIETSLDHGKLFLDENVIPTMRRWMKGR